MDDTRNKPTGIVDKVVISEETVAISLNPNGMVNIEVSPEKFTEAISSYLNEIEVLDSSTAQCRALERPLCRTLESPGITQCRIMESLGIGQCIKLHKLCFILFRALHDGEIRILFDRGILDKKFLTAENIARIENIRG